MKHSGSGNEVGPGPEGIHALEMRMLQAHISGCRTLDLVHDLVGCKGWRAVQEQVNVVRHDLEGHDDAIQSFRLGDYQPTQVFLDRPDKHLPATLRTPVEVENDLSD
jgi:hypothetical protein